jgi:adenylate kinase family enzyme
LARRIAEITGLPYHSVDDLAFLPGWQQVPDDEQRAKIAAIVQQEAWILDSAYGKWLDLILPQKPLILALDYPRWVSFGRLFRRTIARAWDKTPVCNGNVETWRLMFSKESILVWHFKSFASKRRRIHAWAKVPEEHTVMVFRHPRELDDWLDSLARKQGVS